jgi:hypothetical protein
MLIAGMARDAERVARHIATKRAKELAVGEELALAVAS